MSTAVTFWYGCNVLRHGDIIHACLDILRALDYEPSPVGGVDYCCGTVKDANQTAAAGMATRTVGKLNDRGDRKSTRLNSSHLVISYAVFCLKKKKTKVCCSQWIPFTKNNSWNPSGKPAKFPGWGGKSNERLSQPLW